MASKKGPLLTALEEVRKNPTLAMQALAKRKRPAPAATDTGLVTVFTQWINGKEDQLVTRSQAVELLAAKDKQMALAETSMLEMHQELNKLEAAWLEDEGIISDLKADNAAKDARIKELEELLRISESSNHFADNLSKELKHTEAKLAAAEKALGCFLVAYEEDYNLHEAAVEARAVLGGKPS